MNADAKLPVVALGAGMVGVACALALQQRGQRVILVDRKAPGRETSYGNAGVMARSSLLPFNNPGLWPTLPKLIGNRSGSFRYNPGFLARNMRWGLGFLSRARSAATQETATALDALIRLSGTEHRRLLAQAGEQQRLRETGWLFLYRTLQAYAAGRFARQTYAQYGVRTQEVDAAGIADLEPGLRAIFAKGLLIQDSASVDNPGRVVEAYARLFAQGGGALLQREVQGLQPQDNHWNVQCGDMTLQASQVVVAAGPWSRQLLQRVGLNVPMVFERGYHMHYAQGDGPALNRPIYDTGAGYVMSPMEQGLRLTTGVELDDLDAPRSSAQLDLAEAAARQAVALGERLEPEAWLGRRPTLPDSRPAIGRAPGHRHLWLAFGHQHIGFSTGPGTARLLAAMMHGDTLPIDARPFDPGRFVTPV